MDREDAIIGLPEAIEEFDSIRAQIKALNSKLDDQKKIIKPKLEALLAFSTDTAFHMPGDDPRKAYIKLSPRTTVSAKQAEVLVSEDVFKKISKKTLSESISVGP